MGSSSGRAGAGRRGFEAVTRAPRGHGAGAGCRRPAQGATPKGGQRRRQGRAPEAIRLQPPLPLSVCRLVAHLVALHVGGIRRARPGHYLPLPRSAYV
jgi:hypothetical protein